MKRKSSRKKNGEDQRNKPYPNIPPVIIVAIVFSLFGAGLLIGALASGWFGPFVH